LFIYIQGYYERKKGDNTMAKVLISMPERFLSEIDTVAGTENRSRSELIREALRTYIHRNLRTTKTAARNAEILETLLD
jgi:CopG family transcriptional regulator / antitoxin EndoAI